MSDIQNYPPVPPTIYAQTSTLAVISLIFGIICWFVVPFVGAVVAVITGHMAKSEIRSSGGTKTGDGMATAGLVLGYLHLGLTVVGICILFALLAMGVSIPLCGTLFSNQH